MSNGFQLCKLIVNFYCSGIIETVRDFSLDCWSSRLSHQYIYLNTADSFESKWPYPKKRFTEPEKSATICWRRFVSPVVLVTCFLWYCTRWESLPESTSGDGWPLEAKALLQKQLGDVDHSLVRRSWNAWGLTSGVRVHGGEVSTPDPHRYLLLMPD